MLKNRSNVKKWTLRALKYHNWRKRGGCSLEAGRTYLWNEVKNIGSLILWDHKIDVESNFLKQPIRAWVAVVINLQDQ